MHLSNIIVVEAAEYMDSLGVKHALQQLDRATLIEQSLTLIEQSVK